MSGQPNTSPRSGQRLEILVGDACLGSSRGAIQLGILLLIATPVTRVLLSAIGFAWQRDRTYVLVSLAVLGLLLYTLFGNS